MAEGDIILGPNAARGLAGLLGRQDGNAAPVSRRRGDQSRQPQQGIIEVILTEHLEPAAAYGDTETEALAEVVYGAGDAWAQSEREITVVNRSMGLFLPIHSLVLVVRVNNEWRPMVPYNGFIGKTDAASTVDDDVVVSVWYDSIGGGPSGLADSTNNVTCWNRFGNVDSGVWVGCDGYHHGFELKSARC